ncbi:hypothetical protein ANO14919_012280 [Xylariales sp. No.14919]|nr:hypothetical protein F5X98DRAFT_167873 [Xylaria grammica]GAW11875.1 hypothetical protein ANO14919_012280 [Xylariales sp. No.14919]
MELCAHQIPLGPGPYAYHGRHKEMSRATEGSFKLRAWPPAPKPHNISQKKPQHEAGAVCKQEDNKLAAKYLTGQPELPFSIRRAKRVRSSDDVDGEGTAALSCKKRRLLLYLVTSRLSRPFSLPATHILIRGSGDNAVPMVHRIQQLTALGGRRAAGALLVRKAAILNRVRIGVRQAAVSRGHTVMADLAACSNTLNNKLLFVTAPAFNATFPVANVSAILHGFGPGITPPVWRPYSTGVQSSMDHILHRRHHHQHHDSVAAMNGLDVACADADASAIQGGGNYNYNYHNTAAYICANRQEPGHFVPSVVLPAHAPADVSDEEDNTAFPAASFRDRYVDLSDDDMDDVYADFGAIFRSPEARASGSPVEEQFYEEYLDELDGIPWVV